MNNAKLKKSSKKALAFILLVLLGFVMIYPLLWMLGSSFKPNE